MTRRYNKQQSNYLIAKSNLETLKDTQDDMEHKYIKEQGIKNADGTTPTRIYCIRDRETFDRANQEFSNLPEEKEIWDKILEANEQLKKAEDQLLEYALSITPAYVREPLAKAAETNYTTRIKMIDLVLQLDVATVKR